jgi:hypothetical protein
LTTEGTLTRGSEIRTVTAAIEGLAPDTAYHFRVRARNAEGTTLDDDRSFTTTGSVATAGGTDPGPGADANPPSSVAAPSTAAAKPVLGSSVVVAPLLGTIKIKLPGSTEYATLAAGDDVPVGTVVDARRGTVKLTSALSADTTQSGDLRGALFQVRQAASGPGMTDLVLRGENFARCPRPTGRQGVRAATASRRERPLRRLWSRDRGGSFRTHGRNSVATVRGTAWVTTDTCSGTRTTVKEGAVAVRDDAAARRSSCAPAAATWRAAPAEQRPAPARRRTPTCGAASTAT